MLMTCTSGKGMRVRWWMELSGQSMMGNHSCNRAYYVVLAMFIDCIDVNDYP